MTTCQREKVMEETALLKKLPELDRKGIAALSLFGLIQALIDPPSLAVLKEAKRIVFSGSAEFDKIAKMLSIDVTKLRENVFRFLERNGVKCQ